MSSYVPHELLSTNNVGSSSFVMHWGEIYNVNKARMEPRVIMTALFDVHRREKLPGDLPTRSQVPYGRLPSQILHLH